MSNPALQLLASVFDNVHSWMAGNKRLLNSSKREFLFLDTSQQFCKFVSVQFGGLLHSVVF